MKSRVRSLLLAGVVGSAALLAAFAVQGAAAKSAARTGPAAGHPCLVMTGSGDPAFVKNFNPFTSSTLPSGSIVKGAFYEPLMITTPAGGGHQYPWLARSWKWSNGNTTLTLQIAKGATWSDGKPLTAADVAYTLTAGKQDKVLDQLGLYRPGTNVASVRQKGSSVLINLKTPDSQFVAANLNTIFVIPKHIWSKVSNPATFTNSNPIGSGPFTQISRFTTQDYVLSKNPHYWLAGAPKIPCVEYVQASSNDAALLLIQSGQADWTHNFVPDVEKAYVSKDRQHYHAFYATTAYPQGLMLDTTQYPYSLPVLRKAISMAIDRNQVSKLGEYGYAPPADAIGLNGLFPAWVTDANVKAQANQLASYNPAAAKKLLTDNGFTYKGSQLIDPKGNPVSISPHVISGWSDWVASLQIITKNLRDIGIDSQTKLEPDWNSWYPNAASTKFPTLLWQVGSQGSPYGYFFAMMDQNAFIPSGQDATLTGNWIHYQNPQATTLLNKWKVSLNSNAQKKIATQLEQLWIDQLPMVPLFIGPRWSTYSTKYFHGFTSPRNFYGDPIFTQFPDNVLSLTRISPGGQAGL